MNGQLGELQLKISRLAITNQETNGDQLRQVWVGSRWIIRAAKGLDKLPWGKCPLLEPARLGIEVCLVADQFALFKHFEPELVVLAIA